MLVTNILQQIFDGANYLFSLFTDLSINNYANFKDFLDGTYSFWLLTETSFIPANMEIISVPIPDFITLLLNLGFDIFHFFSNAILPYDSPYILHFIFAIITWAAFTKGAKLVLEIFELVNPFG